MDLRRRKIPSASDDTQPSASSLSSLEKRPRENRSFVKSNFLTWKLIYPLFSLGFLTWGIVANFFLPNALYHHRECDMTWSNREFRQVQLPTPSQHNYRLFKFLDRRDVRSYQFLANLATPLDVNDHWCGNLPIVLYIPGHGGSYEQARSLGAHGIQLTRYFITNKEVQEKTTILQNATLESVAAMTDDTSMKSLLDKFMFDVYTVDFQEEPTGLHGRFLSDQATFLAQSIEFLSNTCQQDLHVVAHSMGGYAAKLAIELYPTQTESIKNLITLATPHSFPVLAFEAHLHNLFTVYLQETRGVKHTNIDLTVVSVAGGLRDEIIPPAACQIESSHHSISFSATDLMQSPIDDPSTQIPPLLGMDHKAVVWCHNLLAPIRNLLAILVAYRHDIPAERLQRLQQHHNEALHFTAAVEQQRIRLRETYGSIPAIAMESSFLYNLESLLSIYSVVSVGHLLLSSDPWGFGSTLLSHVVIPGLAAVWFVGRQCLVMPYSLKSVSSFLSWGVIPIYAGLANGVFLSLYWILSKGLDSKLHKATDKIATQAPEQPSLRRVKMMATWMIPMLPFVLAGDIVYMILRRNVAMTGFWITSVLPVIVWIVCHWNMRRHKSISVPPPMLRSCLSFLRFCAVFSIDPITYRLLSRYCLFDQLYCLVYLDLFELLLLVLLGKM